MTAQLDAKQPVKTKRRQRFLLRDEHFGGTLVDRTYLNHIFVSDADIEQGDLELNGVDVRDYQRVSRDLEGTPTDLLYAPIRVYFELTRKCNLRCKTCFNSSGEALDDEMSIEEIMLTLEGLAQDGVLDARFSGGEVTVRDHWKDILQRSLDLGMITSINTNGVYPNSSTLDDLASLGLDQVTISIDGFKKTHNLIRGSSTFERSIESMKELSAAGVPLRVNTVLTKGSAEEMPRILEAVAPYVSEINFFYMRLTGRALTMAGDSLSFEDLYRFEQEIEKQKGSYPDLRILHGSRVMLRSSIDSRLKAEKRLRMGGPDGFTRMNILPNGEIWPGGYTPHIATEFLLGRIQDEGYSMLRIWRESQVLKRFRAYSLATQKKCVACPEKNVRCPGAAVEMELYKDRSDDKTNPYCNKDD